MSPQYAVSSYLTLFTIALAGSFVSVVLSLSLQTVAVSDYRALCRPDFPLELPQAIIFRATSILTFLHQYVEQSPAVPLYPLLYYGYAAHE